MAFALLALAGALLLREPPAAPVTTPPVLTGAAWTDAEASAGKSRGGAEEEDGTSSIDRFLDSLETANLAFNSPATMNLDRTAVVQLVVGPGRTEEDLARLITEAGEVQSASVRIADDMEAKLTSGAFRITPITPALQSVSRREPTEWKWEVQPLQPGPQRLHLTLTAVFLVDGRERQRATTFERIIEVGVAGPSWSRRLTALAGGAGSLGVFAVILQTLFRMLDAVRTGRMSFARWRRRPAGAAAGAPTGDEVFVSYARRDSDAVLPVLDALGKAGVRIWLDRSGIQGATMWSAEIVSAIQRARAVILFCSASSFASEHVQREVSLASEEKRRLLPVRLDTAEPPAAVRYHLAGIQYVEVAGLPPREAAERIRAALETVAPQGAAKP